MRRALRGAARILMAVAVLGGLARPGLAGPPAAPVPLSVSQAHWVEIHLELALLADEATFPGSCTVRVHNGQIELTGVIHSEAARARALRIANQFGTLPVRDGLTVQHKLPATPVSQAVVSEMASRQLLGRLGDQAKRVEVMVHDNNRVVLRGLVDSYEEKLFISRMLRGIAGCTAVQNELQVTPVFVAGRPYQRVSGDGKLAVAAGPATVPVTYVPAAPGTDSAAANPQRPGPVIYKAQSYPRLPTNLVKPEPASYATALAQDRAPQPVVQGDIFTALALPGPDLSTVTPARTLVTPYTPLRAPEPKTVSLVQGNSIPAQPVPSAPIPFKPPVPERATVVVNINGNSTTTPTTRQDPYLPAPTQPVRALDNPSFASERPRVSGAQLNQAPDKTAPAPDGPTLYKPSSSPQRATAAVNQNNQTVAPAMAPALPSSTVQAGPTQAAKAPDRPASCARLPVLPSTQAAAPAFAPTAAAGTPAPSKLPTTPECKPVVVAQAASNSSGSWSCNPPAPAGTPAAAPRLLAVPEGTTVSTHEVPQQKPMGGLIPRILPFGPKADQNAGRQTATVTTVAPSRPIIAAPAPTQVVMVGQMSPAPASVSHKPYVANGVIIFDDDVKTPAPSLVAVAQADLKNRVLAVTAGKARSVDVVVGADRITRIVVTAATPVQERELREKIMKFPELYSGSVILETIVSPR